MTEERGFPYGGVPVYNPLSLSKVEALAQFHARQAAYQSLIDLLREERPSHVLIIGTRGMGKTTLLQRVRYGVEDDAELNGRYLVLAFPEEQYNVNRLHRFLLNAVDALADAIERLNDKPLLERIEKFIGEIGKCSPGEIEERVPEFLMETGRRMQKNFLLLVDNADRLFEVIEAGQQWRLRELLSSRSDLTFFGATTQASDGIYGPDRAFFEFFKIYQLAALTFEEVRDLLLRLSESVEEKEGEKGAAKRRVAEWLDADAARLRTLVQLTGGNPRTTVLLFHLVLDGLAGGAREYLEQLLDQVTPTYKGRVDELPPQAQQVLDAVAIRWDPVIAVDVAEDTGLDTSVVSAQLTRLVRQGILEKADPGHSKKALYQVAERFFNIWYLMRASRRVRAKLRWFVEFLRVFFDSGELERMAWDKIERSRSIWRAHPEEIETAFAYVLASGAGRDRLEDYLRQRCADIEEVWMPYLELLTGAPDAKIASIVGGAGWATSPDSNALAALVRAAKLYPDLPSNFAKLIKDLVGWPPSPEDVVAIVRREIESGPTPDGLVGAFAEILRKATELESRSAWLWGALAMVLSALPTCNDEAEATCRRAIDLDSSPARYWSLLGSLLQRKPERALQSEAAFQKAISQDPKDAESWNGLAYVLAGIPGRESDAVTACREAIKWNPRSGACWNNLGNVLAKTPDRAEEAEAAYRTAIELDPKNPRHWSNLGILLSKAPERTADAETAYRKATELDATSAGTWANLGAVLARTPNRADEAEAALRRAVELDATLSVAWARLGALLMGAPNRSVEAEAAVRKAISLNRNPELEPTYWELLGVFLASVAGKPIEAEAALRRAMELGPHNSRNLQNLGVLLYCELSKMKEAAAFLRRAHELDPSDQVLAAIFATSLRSSETAQEHLPISIDAAREAGFWDELLSLCRGCPPFGKLLLGVCDLVQDRDNLNRFARLYRAVAFAQLGDFPRASVALEDALTGDPIDLLDMGQEALETFFAAAVECGRVRDCIDLIDKKEWKDAWRPIYEALRAVEAGSADYLKRIAVEIRTPALLILRRIAPQLPDLPEPSGPRSTLAPPT